MAINPRALARPDRPKSGEASPSWTPAAQAERNRLLQALQAKFREQAPSCPIGENLICYQGLERRTTDFHKFRYNEHEYLICLDNGKLHVVSPTGASIEQQLELLRKINQEGFRLLRQPTLFVQESTRSAIDRPSATRGPDGVGRSSHPVRLTEKRTEVALYQIPANERPRMANVTISKAKEIDQCLGTARLIQDLTREGGGSTNETPKVPPTPTEIGRKFAEPMTLRLGPDLHDKQTELTLALYMFLLRSPFARALLERTLGDDTCPYGEAIEFHLPGRDEDSTSPGLGEVRQRLEKLWGGLQEGSRYPNPADSVDQALAAVLLHQCQLRAERGDSEADLLVHAHHVIRFAADIIAYGGHSKTKNEVIRSVHNALVENRKDDPLDAFHRLATLLSGKMPIDFQVNGLSWPSILGATLGEALGSIGTRETHVRHYRDGGRYPTEYLTIVPAHLLDTPDSTA